MSMGIALALPDSDLDHVVGYDLGPAVDLPVDDVQERSRDRDWRRRESMRRDGAKGFGGPSGECLGYG